MTGVGEFGLQIVQNNCCFASESAKSKDTQIASIRSFMCAVGSNDLKCDISTYAQDQIIDLMVWPYAHAKSHPAEK